jgi:hypothetical protein
MSLSFTDPQPLSPAAEKVKTFLTDMLRHIEKIGVDFHIDPINDEWIKRNYKQDDRIALHNLAKRSVQNAIEAISNQGDIVLDDAMLNLSRSFVDAVDKTSRDYPVYKAIDRENCPDISADIYSARVKHAEEALKIAQQYASIVSTACEKNYRYDPRKAADHVRAMHDYALTLLGDPSEQVRDMAAKVQRGTQVSALDPDVIASKAFPANKVTLSMQAAVYAIFADQRESIPHRLEASLEYLTLAMKQIHATHEAMPKPEMA